VADVVARLAPEVIALQEVHEADLPELLRLLAEQHDLRLEAAFAAALPAGDARLARLADVTRHSPYGIGVLSAAPVDSSETVPLPSEGDGEPRVAQVVQTSLAGRPVTVVNLHLSTDGGGLRARLLGRGSPRAAQAEAVLTLAGALSGPVVVLGDWNQEWPELAVVLRRTGVHRRLRLASDPWPATTIGGSGIDHVLVGGGLRPRSRSVERSTVSDHRPVLVGLDVPP
jgi:endonuclease/exonuclease/phosphatase family metal-dependent hydrolase